MTVGGVHAAGAGAAVLAHAGHHRRAPPERGEHARDALADWGFSKAEAERLASLGLGFTS